jgi:energy-converting hydrogenase A subunit R
MLRAVNKSGGLAIAFNANEYALPYSTLGLASVSLYDLWIVLEAWEKGGREDVERVVKEMEKAGGAKDRGWFQWLDGIGDVVPVSDIHKKIRRLARQEAAELG